MAVTQKTHRELVQLQAAAVQSKASGLLDFGQGSVLRALIQAVGGVALWLQANVLAVLRMTRLTTSASLDVDSFVADFAGPMTDGDTPLLARFSAAPSKGLVEFSRLSATGEVLIPLGATVETRDNRQRFKVTLDATLTSWRPDLDGYLMANTVASLQVPAQAVTGGMASNVQAGAISVITTAIPGVDLVSNPADFAGGLDAEQDEAYKIRFRAWVRSLREGTDDAIVANIEALGSGVQAKVVEFEDLDGTPRGGFFYVIVDDGTGYPPASLIEAASAQVRLHRADGVQAAVYAPTVIPVNIAYTLDLQATGHEAADLSAAQAAARLYVDGRELGEKLIYNRLYGAIYDAADSIREVIGLTINGGTADITPLKYKVVKAGTVTGTPL
jgi:uncharacterized phage protein gp47/JayE